MPMLQVRDNIKGSLLIHHDWLDWQPALCPILVPRLMNNISHKCNRSTGDKQAKDNPEVSISAALGVFAGQFVGPWVPM